MNKSKWLNTSERFGWGSILLHWSMAIALIGMYFLGDYMVELDYYDTWYHQAPDLHKAIGVILGFVVIFRFVWNMAQSKPRPLEDNAMMVRLAKLGHLALYGLIMVLLISGYLISTAKGKGIDVFGLFELPAMLASNPDRGEIAGKIHELIGTVFILMVGLHAMAAFFHHLVLKDRTLKRMLWVKPKGE